MDELKNRFHEDVDRVEKFYVQLRRLSEEQSSFEERLRFLVLRFPLERVLHGDFQPSLRGLYVYCFFVQARSLSHLHLEQKETLLAYKIKAQMILGPEEKNQALHFLRKLALGQTAF